MSCAACSARVEKAAKSIPNVESCSVNLLLGRLSVEGDVSDADIISAVEKAGYKAEPSDGSKAKSATNDNNGLQASVKRRMLMRLLSSSFLVALLMYLSMGHAMLSLPIPRFLSESPISLALSEFLLSASVLLINYKIFVSGFLGILRGAPNMNTLVSLGSLASFVYSTAVTVLIVTAARDGSTDLAHSYLHELYFEAAAMIVTLITLGKLLEERARAKTTSAIDALVSLSPKTATVIRDGSEIQIAAEEMLIGEIFVIRPGEIIPADGTVIYGESSVDESALTGEGMPQEKARGARVLAGSQNKNGTLRCEASAIGEGTAISAVIRAVEDASSTKAPIARLADKISAIFVPIVMAVAVLTFCIWLICGADFGYSLARGISVLVISCPCALGLATPVAITVGSGVGAKFGILFKSAEALETLGRAKTVVLDKTGTVTNGKPAVTDLVALDVSEEELLFFAASAELGSEHPLGRAIVEHAESRGIQLSDCESFTALTGHGISATVEGVCVIGGAISLLSNHREIPDEILKKHEELSSCGKTAILFGNSERLFGIIAVADTLKKDGDEAVRELSSLGMRVVMLTGDNRRTAKAIADKAGISELYAETLPEGKAELVRSFGEGCVMVGDGINDAPALKAAEVGIAIGGTDIAVTSADVVILNGSLTSVPRAIRLSRATLGNIKENLFWAFIYNVIGIPLAAGAFIHLFGWQMNPMIGAMAMSISSLVVVTNSLRLWLFDKRRSVSNKPSEKSEENKSAASGEIGDNMKITLKIDGMMCPHCEARVKKCLEEIDGVASAAVSHKDGSAEISLIRALDRQIFVDAVTAQGYAVIA